MKVLKKPDIDSWKKVVTCGNCTAELEIVEKDVACEYSSGNFCYSVNCPECITSIDVPASSLTKPVEALLKRRATYSSSSYYDR